MLEVLNSRALLSAIKNSSKDVAVLFGSPLSAPDSTSDYGVPNVNGVISIIESYVEEKGVYEDYADYVKGLNHVEKYQKSFSFVKGWLGQDAVNEIIEQAVLKSVYSEKLLNTPDELNKDLEAWHLPSATKALGKILSKDNLINGPALTTNFDPLMSISINTADGQSYQTILHTDGNLSQSRSVASNSIQVVHLHGYWHDSETLHTPDQLNFERPKLKASLAKLLKNKALLVVGYGGWDDVFTQALAELMSDDDAKLDIMWAFYEETSSTISNIYKKLLTNVEPAIRKGRFRAYGGINCHDFLLDLEKVVVTNDTQKKALPVEKEGFLTVNDPKLNEEVKSSSIIEWNYYPELAHQFVRETEHYQLSEIYSKCKVVNVFAEWGMARKPFLNTFLSQKAEASLYYVDLEGITCRDDALSAVKKQLHVELQQLVKEISKHKSVLVFDNVENQFSKTDSVKFGSIIIELSQAITEFSSNIKVILGSRKELDAKSNAKLHLTKLEEFDIKKYIESHSQYPILPCDKELLDKISRLSDGMPMLIDRVLSELKFMSIDEVIESNHRPESFEEFSEEPVPQSLVTIIDELKNSESALQRHAFNLLKVLSVMSYGDTFSNIKRSFPTKPFHPSHLQVLNELDFLQVQNINTSELEVKKTSSNYDSKLLIVPTLIKEYVFSKLSQKEILDIVKRAADQHFGEEWKSGRLKLCSSDMHLLTEENQHSGSALVVLTHLLRGAVESQNTILLKQAFRICLSLSMYLKSKSKYRELNSFASDIKMIIKETSEELDISKLNALHGNSLRMLGVHEEAIKVMRLAVGNIKELNRDEKSSLFLNLALAYKMLEDNTNANLYANKVKEISKKGSATYQQADSVLVLVKNDNVKKELAEIETNARNSKNISTANNAALDIARNTVDTKGKLGCYSRVLNSDGDVYNKVRAITNKYSLLIDEDEGFKINEKDKALIYTAYLFSYNQRLSGIFNRAHKVVWHMFLNENNIISLVKLYRLSSLYWRIVGNKKNELKYAVELRTLVTALLPEDYQLPETRYVQLRIRTIV